MCALLRPRAAPRGCRVQKDRKDIEGENIVYDDEDRNDFLARMGDLASYGNLRLCLE